MKNKLLFTLFLPIFVLASCGGNTGDSTKLVSFKSNVPKTYQYELTYTDSDLYIKLDVIRNYIDVNEKTLYVEYSHRFKTDLRDNSNEESEMLAIWSDKDNKFNVYDWKGNSYRKNQYAYSSAEHYLTTCDNLEFKESNVKTTKEYIECNGHGDDASYKYRISNDEYKICIYRHDSEGNSTWLIEGFTSKVTMQVGHDVAIMDIDFEG